VPQFRGAGKPAPGIVYDSDLGATIDSVLALALLHGFEGKTEARIAGLTIDNPNLISAQLCDVIEKFYASAITGLAATFFKGAPIGLATTGKETRGAPIATALLAKKDESGNLVYSPAVHKLTDTAVPEILIRNALTAQYDQSASVVLAGPATTLVKLLDLTGAQDLIQSKVKVLVFAGGSFTAAEPDAALLADLPAARRLFAEWPTPIVAAGREIGAALPFPGSSIETDFAYAPAHPIAAAYRAYQPMPYDAPATAMAAVLCAARPKETYFKLSEPGTIGIGNDGRAAFHASSGGKHRYLIADPSRKEEILKIYTTLASAKPVARTFRIPFAVDDVKKDQPEKP
jgi:hypothetical protein